MTKSELIETTGGSTAGADADKTVRVLLYSDDRNTRDAVKRAVGRRPAKGAPRVEWLEIATHAAVIEAADAGGFDLMILDGEAAKSGGLGLCRQLKDEIFNCPPIMVLIGRVQDEWLAAWSYADGTATFPLDPIEVAGVVAGLLTAPSTVSVGASLGADPLAISAPADVVAR